MAAYRKHDNGAYTTARSGLRVQALRYLGQFRLWSASYKLQSVFPTYFNGHG